jgi:hypothetical protein
LAFCQRDEPDGLIFRLRQNGSLLWLCHGSIVPFARVS